MRSLEEIRRKINGTMQLAGNTYAGRIRTKKLSGSVMFSFDESGWEHVSVSPYNGKTPTWDDMCEIKDMFWNEEEAVIQIHPKKSEYVNIVDNCLHLWRHKYIELPR